MLATDQDRALARWIGKVYDECQKAGGTGDLVIDCMASVLCRYRDYSGSLDLDECARKLGEEIAEHG